MFPSIDPSDNPPGHIGIVDHDTTDSSNLQRQTLHTEARLGQLKANSAVTSLQALNSHNIYTAYPFALDPLHAFELVAQYDVVLDCTDRPFTRYLVNDACVLTGKPLISGAAMRFDGQLCIYNLPYKGEEGEELRGPCYRCLFPVAPKGSEAGTCEEEGVLGGITGIIGVLQAVECVKYLVGLLGMFDRFLNLPCHPFSPLGLFRNQRAPRSYCSTHQ